MFIVMFMLGVFVGVCCGVVTSMVYLDYIFSRKVKEISDGFKEELDSLGRPWY